MILKPTQPDFLFNLQPGDIGYDIEVYPNVYTCRLTHTETGQKWCFEISPRRNDLELFCLFMDKCREVGNRWVGFNNIGYDYPVVHFIYRNRNTMITAPDIYAKSMSIIDALFNARFAHMVWESDWVVPQIDLYKIHHFDNKAKATSLKVMEFNMRMESVEDLPFPVGIELNNEQIDVLLGYNDHDVDATVLFYHKSKGQIALRESLTEKFGKNMMNQNDVKIGETILAHSLEERGIPCFIWVDGKKKKLQTQRESINLGEVILPYVNFENPAFQSVKNWVFNKTVEGTKNVFGPIKVTREMTEFMDHKLIRVRGLVSSDYPGLKFTKGMVNLAKFNENYTLPNTPLIFLSGTQDKSGLNCIVDGLKYKFGTGGLHMSVDSQIVESTNTHQLVDVDVKSFYPRMAIVNRLFPAHLGEGFCDAYQGVYDTRISYPKGTPDNEAFKLALNGAYGGSNNEYSPFFDPQYTMSITINGQLLLCMLVEQLVKIPGLRMIQANTDGVTYLCPREYLEHARSLNTWWEALTNLELEEQLYSRMFIRDVNSYIAEYEGGKLKRIGAYAYETAEENPGTRELPYHKDWSARVVAKAAEASLVRGEDIREFIESHSDVFDFFLRTKVPRSSSLEWGNEKVANTIRYYISTEGKRLEKVMPPAGPIGAFKRANKLTDTFYSSVMAEIGQGVWDERIHTKNKSVYDIRRSGVNTGWNVMMANDLEGSDCKSPQGYYQPEDLNFEWYIKEAEKLVTLLKDN